MSKPIACLIGYMLYVSFLFSQVNSCPNVDLASGNFNSWTGYTGTYYAPGTNFGIVNGRHTIITQQATDPNTCNQLSVIPPGHTKSIRLGNATVGAEAEQLVYSIQVTPQSSLFIYKYAVVLENPGHSPTQQPKFETKILNALGMPIGGGCGTYTVYGGQPGQNFQQCGSRTWLPWTTVGLDLTPYMGQTIQIEFTTWDCAQGAHFGYAYLAAECLPLSIDVNYCGGNQPLILTAPAGFQSYVWQPGNLTGQQVTINNPTLNQNYTCTMTTYSNQGTCSVDLSVQASPTIVSANFTYAAGCENEPIAFVATSTVSSITPNLNLTHQWLFGNANPNNGNGSSPTTLFNGPGNHTIQLISSSSNGCSDTIQQVISILPTPHITPIIDAPCINQQTTFSLLGNTTMQGVIWDFGDGTPSVSGDSVMHAYITPGNYLMVVVGIGTNGCSDTVSMPLNIQPLPWIYAGADTSICPGNSIILSAQGGLSYTWEQGLNQGQPYLPQHQEFLTVSGIDSNNCLVLDSFQVSIYQIDSVQAMPPAHACFGDSIQLLANAFGGLWWEGGYPPMSWVTESIGMHTYIVHGSDIHGCTSSDTTIIEIYPLPAVNAGNDTIVCTGTPITIMATGAAQYQWSNQGMNGSNVIISNNTNLSVVGTSTQGCQAIDSIHIGIDSIPNLEFNVGPQTGCIPLTVSLENLSTGNSFTQVQWMSNSGQHAAGNQAQLLFTEIGCYDITLIVSTPLGCNYSSTHPQIVCTHPLPTAQFAVPATPLTTINYGGTFSNNSIGAGGYVWDFGDGSPTSTEAEPYHNFPDQSQQTYEVMLIAYNEFGCADTSIQVVQITEELAFYVPNSFTPDGDEYNNIWKPVFSNGLDLQDYHAAIYNRWGEIIWESYDANVGWDGSIGNYGLDIQDGVYIYSIVFGYKNTAKKEHLTGHIVRIN